MMFCFNVWSDHLGKKLVESTTKVVNCLHLKENEILFFSLFGIRARMSHCKAFFFQVNKKKTLK